MKHSARILPVLLSALLLLSLLTGCTDVSDSLGNNISETVSATPTASAAADETSGKTITMDNLPEYSGSPYVVLNNNVPEFSEEAFVTESSEFYIELDQFGRCGACYADIGQDLMPTEERGSISSVHPSGWDQAEYDFIDGKNLYNRCHLIGYQLTGENANDCNLITGTRYLNVTGMLPFEDEVAEYIKETGNHVLYRVAPYFVSDELVARGVHMEACSVEDNGEGVSFNVYCYNVQPGVTIDYATGASRLAVAGEYTYVAEDDGSAEVTPAAEETTEETAEDTQEYVLNTNSMKFHLPSCGSVDDISTENREDYTGTRQSLIDQGYSPCGRCKP